MWKWICLAIVAIGLGFIVLYPFTKPSLDETKIENWALYKATNDKVALSSCDNKDFKSAEQEINSGKHTRLKLDQGLFLLSTDNPEHWTNDEFRWFLTSKCSSENFSPVRAYRDRLLWKSACSSLNRFLFGCGTSESSLKNWENINAKSSGIGFSGNEFNEAGIQFTIPPHIFHTQTSNATSEYLSYNFYTEGNTIFDTSSLELLIPLVNNIGQDYDPYAGIPKGTIRKMTNWSVLQGDKYEYTFKFDDPTYSRQGTKTTEIYPVSYSDQPIVLSYSHTIHDDTLEMLWTNIHSMAKISIPENLGAYQGYRIKRFGSLVND